VDTLPTKTRRWLVVVVKGAVAALVVWGIWWLIAQARDDFASQQFSLQDIRPWWLVAAAVFYVAGLSPMWWFWYRTLWALGQKPDVLASLQAYFFGHLGKYVPGKAMVVVLRTAIVRGGTVDTTIAAVSVFVETLTVMAVGAFLAGAILAVRFSDQTHFQALAWFLMIATGVPTVPPVFRRLVRWLKVPRANPNVITALEGLTYRLIIEGWAACTVGWFLMGLSLWATLKAVPLGTPLAAPWELLPRLTASLSLAIVAGFLSFLPGGLGVRDLVLDRFMVPEFGEVKACIAVVLLRLVWLVTELAVSAILYFGSRAEVPRHATKSRFTVPNAPATHPGPDHALGGDSRLQ
jgi:hypothetical protein